MQYNRIRTHDVYVQICDEFYFLTFQDKEVTNGGSAPRILSIDDYFMAEHDIVFKDPDTGKTITKTVSKN